MRPRLALAAATAALMLAGPLAAHSGPYDIQLNRGTAALVATVEGNQIRGIPLADGSEGFVFLFERETSQVRGNFILPEPDPKADPVLPPEYIGCIAVRKGSLVDYGCVDPDNPEPPTYLDADPALNELSLSFTVISDRGGFRLTTTLVLAGQGQPAPFEHHESAVTPAPPERPTFVIAQGVAYLGRAAIARGSIRSDLIGGGSVRPATTPNSTMIHGVFDFDRSGDFGVVMRPGFKAEMITNRIACFPEPEPGAPPSPIPPGCHPF